MSSNINRVTLTGNLTRDPELRSTAGGMAVLKLSLAVNDRRKVDGEWTDVANFFDVIVFGTRAESLTQYLAKGRKIAVDGRLRWSQWQTDDGGKRSKVEVVADDIELLSYKDDAATPPTADAGDEIPF